MSDPLLPEGEGELSQSTNAQQGEGPPNAMAQQALLGSWRYYIVIIFHTLEFLAEAIAIAAITLLNWGKPCDQPLQLSVLVVGAVSVVNILGDYYDRFFRGSDWLETENPPRNNFDSFRDLLALFSLVWFVMSNVWTFSCETCQETNPQLYKLSLALIITFYIIHFGLPILMIIGFFCFFPLGLMIASVVRGNGFAGRGIASSSLRKLPTKAFKGGDIPEDSANCVICLDDYVEGENLVWLSCDHHFHKKCIFQWFKLHDACPICRKTAVPSSNGDEQHEEQQSEEPDVLSVEFPV